MGRKIQKSLLLLLTCATVALVLASGALARAGELEDAIAELDSAFRGDDYRAKVAAVERLVATHEARAIQVVVERALTSDDQFVFERTVEVLKEKTDEAERDMLAVQSGKHPNRDVRVVLTRMLGTLETKKAVEAIIAALKDREWSVRAAAVRAARERRAKALVSPLIDAIAAEDGRVRYDAIEALRDLTGASYGKDAKRWAEWWASVEAGFVLKPPAAGGDGEVDASDVVKDVETVSREGLYDIRSKRTLFVVDVSASMEARTAKGTRLEVVKRELKRVIGELEDDMLFNVLFFSDKATLWQRRMVKASDSNRATAIRVVQSRKAEGMTAAYDALKTAFGLDDVDTIYFLTDGFPTAGAVTSEELIKTEVRKWNRTKGIAIHTIAFVAGELKGEREDKARSKAFMRELAAENGGMFKVVE